MENALPIVQQSETTPRTALETYKQADPKPPFSNLGYSTPGTPAAVTDEPGQDIKHAQDLHLDDESSQVEVDNDVAKEEALEYLERVEEENNNLSPKKRNGHALY